MPKSVKNTKTPAKKTAAKKTPAKAAKAPKQEPQLSALHQAQVDTINAKAEDFKANLHTLGATDPKAEKPEFRDAKLEKAAKLIDQAAEEAIKFITE